MIKLFAVFSMFLFSFTGYAQKDSSNPGINTSEVNKIWKESKSRFPLKRGFYKSYEEYLNNAPSEQRAFTLKDKTKSQERKDKDICAVDYNLDEGQEKLGKVWGFCDGNAVYIKVSPLEGKYWKISHIGPYSFFVHVYQVRTLAGIIAAGAMGTREFSIINSHGKMIYATTNYMKKILGKCPGLAEAYSAEADMKDEEVKKAYLRRANEYFALNPEALD